MPEVTTTTANSLAAVHSLKSRMSQSIIGQERMIERLLIGLLANGNLLVEGLPGLAKTRAIKSLAKCLDAGLSRIQFTPDLLPSDITGSEIYYTAEGKGKFKFQSGPIFNNLILADEINRAPAKVQAALLEAMEERQVTVAGKTHKLPDLFLVMATQNPIEQEGTYPLPEAQMDRFLMHVYVGYPDDKSEEGIMMLVRGEEEPAEKAGGAGHQLTPQDVIFTAIGGTSRPGFGGGRNIYRCTDGSHSLSGPVWRRSQEVDSSRRKSPRHDWFGQMLAGLCLASRP
jgi:MoxR-like ATPase